MLNWIWFVFCFSYLLVSNIKILHFLLNRLPFSYNFVKINLKNRFLMVKIVYTNEIVRLKSWNTNGFSSKVELINKIICRTALN